MSTNPTKTAKATTDTEAPAPQVDNSKALSEARTAAIGRLREAHREEFNALMVEEAEKRGVKWTPRLTEEEKAEKALRELLAAHPELAEKARSGAL